MDFLYWKRLFFEILIPDSSTYGESGHIDSLMYQKKTLPVQVKKSLI